MGQTQFQHDKLAANLHVSSKLHVWYEKDDIHILIGLTSENF